MNTPPLTDADNAVKRVVEVVNELDQVTALEVRRLEAQRDELAACLREVENGFISGRFLCLESTRPEQVANFAAFLTRLHTALLRCAVRERLDDRVAAERRGQEGAV